MITESILLFITDLYGFSIFFWFYLSRFCVCRNFSILSRVSNLLTYSCSWYSLIVLFISMELAVMSSFCILSLVIWVHLLFFLVNIDKNFSFVDLFKESIFKLIFLYYFSISILFTSALIFIIFFHLPALDLICFLVKFLKF